MKGPFLFEYLTFIQYFQVCNNLTPGVTSVFCQQRSPLLGLGPAPAPGGGGGGHRTDKEMVISRGTIDQIMRWVISHH